MITIKKMYFAWPKEGRKYFAIQSINVLTYITMTTHGGVSSHVFQYQLLEGDVLKCFILWIP